MRPAFLGLVSLSAMGAVSEGAPSGSAAPPAPAWCRRYVHGWSVLCGGLPLLPVSAVLEYGE